VPVENINFEARQAAVPERCQEKIRLLVAWLSLHPVIDVALDGHAEDLNREDAVLTPRRVKAVRDALVVGGVDPRRIRIVASAAPASVAPVSVCSGQNTPACKEQKPRVEVLVIAHQF